MFLFAFSTVCVFLLSACDQQTETIENNKMVSVTAETISPVQDQEIELNTETEIQNDNIIIENKKYLFDVTDHTIEEFEALLNRAEEVSQAHAPGYEDLKIVMIIHGPDIDWFTRQNYESNRKLIDLAARLDAYEIIDMKVCEKTMSIRGVDRENIPSFIESVPYAPIEIENRLKEGFIHL